MQRKEYDDVTEFLTFHLEEELEAETDYTIVVPLSGAIKDDLAGIYYSQYTDGNQTRYEI